MVSGFPVMQLKLWTSRNPRYESRLDRANKGRFSQEELKPFGRLSNNFQKFHAEKISN